MTAEPKTGWELLHSELPAKALKAISKDVYGVEGLTDVNEGYLITRLFASKLPWSWDITRQEYLGSEVRRTRGQNPYDYTVYLAQVQGVLTIGEQRFSGSGAHDNRKIDAAFKGAATVAFKNATKMAGLFMQLLMDGRAIDFIYETRDGVAVKPAAEKPADPPAKTSPASEPAPAGNASEGSPASSASNGSASTTPTENSSSTESSAPAEKPKLTLTDRQAKAIKYLLEELPEDARKVAKEAAWAKMQAGLVRGNDVAVRAGFDELVRHHNAKCGPNCKHFKVAEASGVFPIPEEAAAA